MKGLFRYLFVVQYNYRDTAQAIRARVALPLISSIAILGLIFGLFLVVASLAGQDLRDSAISLGGIVIPGLIIWSAVAMWLTQRGAVSAATALIALLLLTMVGISLYVDGIAPSPLLLIPVVLVYMGLIYGARGIVLMTVLTWLILPVTAYLQSEGNLRVEAQAFDDLLQEALISAQTITLSALLLWLFAWNLQQALARAAQIAARTRATAATGQAISRLLNVNELLTISVDLIRDRFALYQVQILMVDETRSYANLSASTGEVGQALLTQGYRVPINSRTAVGESVITGELRYVRDLHTATYQLPDPLAECRSELIIPLSAGEAVVGVLDILSTRLGAFGEEDIEAMRIVANQIGQGLQNARLFETQQRNLLQNRRLFLESETNLREIERLNQQLTGQSWRQYLSERHGEKFGVRMVGNAAQAEEVDWTPAMRQAVERGRAVSQDDDTGQTLAVPVVIRGQPVGAIEVKLPPQSINQAEVRNIVQAIIERLAFSLENIRLFEQAQMAAEREQHINRMTAQLQGLTSVEDILMTAVSTLGQVLNADQGLIRLVEYEAVSSDQSQAKVPLLPTAHDRPLQSGRTSIETIIPGTVTGQKGQD
ncbi:MAG: GAF domain-containing protein [Chloroflexi bacterium]|nr:GAF domain-containing protein [Chloroflexota bacterium]